MCDPVTIATTSLAVASSATAAYGQSQAAGAQADYQNKQYTATANAAQGNYIRNVGVVQDRIGQEAASTGQQAEASSIQIAQAEASARVGFGEAGVAGNSVNSLLGDFQRHEAQNNFALQTNLGWLRSQSAAQMAGLQAQAQSNISSATPSPISSPSGLGAGLMIGAQLFGGLDRYQQFHKEGPYNPNLPTNINPSADPLNEGPAATGQRTNWLYRKLFS